MKRHPSLRKNVRHPEAGLTLMELVISIVVGAIVSLGLVSQVMQAIRYAQLPRQQAQAAFLYQEKMEEVLFTRKSGNYGDVIEANFPDEAPITGFTEYDRTVHINEAPTDCQGGFTCKEVTITISGNSSLHPDETVFLVNSIKVYDY